MPQALQSTRTNGGKRREFLTLKGQKGSSFFPRGVLAMATSPDRHSVTVFSIEHPMSGTRPNGCSSSRRPNSAGQRRDHSHVERDRCGVTGSPHTSDGRQGDDRQWEVSGRRLAPAGLASASVFVKGQPFLRTVWEYWLRLREGRFQGAKGHSGEKPGAELLRSRRRACRLGRDLAMMANRSAARGGAKRLLCPLEPGPMRG